MATFYVLPPKEFVGEWYSGYLQSFFPGLIWSHSRRLDLVEVLLQAVTNQRDVFVIHREELPADENLTTVLTEAFGAEPGDDVVEVHAAAVPGKWMARRWRLTVQAA